MIPEPDLHEIDPKVQAAILDAASAMGEPTDLRRQLAELGEPSNNRSRNNKPNIGQRKVYFAIGAACIILLFTSVVWINTGSEKLESNDFASKQTTPDDQYSEEEETTSSTVKVREEVPNEPLDDPNDLFDGSEGRAEVSPNPIPSGYPSPSNTGLFGVAIETSDLTISEGLEITTDNTVVDRLDIRGSVTVKADNVTIRNSLITTDSVYAIKLDKNFNGLLIEDSRIRGVGRETGNVLTLAGTAEIKRVHITGGSKSISASKSLLLEDSYLTGLYRDSESTRNNIQIRSGEDYTIRRNTIIGPWQLSTSALLLQAAVGDIDNLIVEDNYLSGGGYTIYTSADDDEFSFTNSSVINNRFEKDSWGSGWQNNSAGVIYEDNTQLDS